MTKEKFILLSLKEEKAKKLAQVISNESCRKILDYLAEKDATETELAEKLTLPISTVHYNLRHLVDGGLVVSEEFHYSPKGKEVAHYRLANKYIIIAPKTIFGIKQKLKSILPVILLIGAAAFVLQYFQKFFVQGGITRIFTDTRQTIVRETMMQKAADIVEEAAVEKAKTAATSAVLQETSNMTTEYALSPEITTQTITTSASIWSNIAVWFLIGAFFAIIVYLLISYILNKKE